MKDAVKEYERAIRASNPTSRSSARSKDGPSVLAGWFGDRRPLELWAGFLYGQPMWLQGGEDDWDEESSISDDFRTLLEVYAFAREYKHVDAQDASIDALRDIVQNHSADLLSPFTSIFIRGCHGTSRPAKMLMDHVVNGKCVAQAREWISSYNREKSWLEAADDLEHELCKLYLEKGEKEGAGEGPPDLMARCRYHAHIEHDQPCYLDK